MTTYKIDRTKLDKNFTVSVNIPEELLCILTANFKKHTFNISTDCIDFTITTPSDPYTVLTESEIIKDTIDLSTILTEYNRDSKYVFDFKTNRFLLRINSSTYIDEDMKQVTNVNRSDLHSVYVREGKKIFKGYEDIEKEQLRQLKESLALRGLEGIVGEQVQFLSTSEATSTAVKSAKVSDDITLLLHSELVTIPYVVGFEAFNSDTPFIISSIDEDTKEITLKRGDGDFRPTEVNEIALSPIRFSLYHIKAV